MRAQKCQKKAARVNFDWPELSGVVAKIDEELAEIKAAIASHDATAVSDELGDLLFAVVNLARHLDADPEATLSATNQKFVRRFGAIERALAAQGKQPQDSTLAEMDALWDAAKAAEKTVEK